MNLTAVPVVETSRLRLRQATPADADFFLELLNDPAFVQNIGDRGVRTLADATRYIVENVLVNYERLGFGLYVVEKKPGVIRAGICGLLKRDCLADVDLGFAYLPAFRGQGLAFEAATAVLAQARERWGIARVVAVAKPENARSLHLLGRLGMVPQGWVRLPGQAAESRLLGPPEPPPAAGA